MTRIALMLAGAAFAAAPALAQTTAPAATAPAQTTAPAAGAAAPAATTATATTKVAAGAQVVDTAGGAVGSIESVANGIAVLSTGTNKVSVPASSFAQGPNALVIAMTKADIDAKASAATAAANAPVEVTVGAIVSGPSGAKVGTVKEVKDTTVVVASATASAQLPKTAFAKGPSGLVIGMSPAEFEAAAKSAGGASPGGA